MDASNPAGQPLTISSASDVLTYVAVAPNTNSVGENIMQASLRFSPAQVPANGSATIQFQVPLRFSRVDACSGIPGTSQVNGQVTIVTSAGTFSAANHELAQPRLHLSRDGATHRARRGVERVAAPPVANESAASDDRELS